VNFPARSFPNRQFRSSLVKGGRYGSDADTLLCELDELKRRFGRIREREGESSEKVGSSIRKCLKSTFSRLICNSTIEMKMEGSCCVGEGRGRVERFDLLQRGCRVREVEGSAVVDLCELTERLERNRCIEFTRYS
jgi:hypothetical protein